jgi:hypothetical protein
MGLGSYPTDDPLAMSMLGMHGTVYANYAIDQVGSCWGISGNDCSDLTSVEGSKKSELLPSFIVTSSTVIRKCDCARAMSMLGMHSTVYAN